MALAMTVLMLSLAGLPPLLGFWGKYYVFIAAVGAGLVPLAVIGVIASTIGLFYYLRIVKVMWFDEPLAGFEPMSMELKLVAGAATIFIFPAYIVLAGPLFAAAAAAAHTFF
jgi:NADH-quinone oxidoreductase subunit N